MTSHFFSVCVPTISSAAQAAAVAQQLLQELDDSLPPGWVEKTDKKSGRLYYVNE